MPATLPSQAIPITRPHHISEKMFSEPYLVFKPPFTITMLPLEESPKLRVIVHGKHPSLLHRKPPLMRSCGQNPVRIRYSG